MSQDSFWRFYGILWVKLQECRCSIDTHDPNTPDLLLATLRTAEASRMRLHAGRTKEKETRHLHMVDTGDTGGDRIKSRSSETEGDRKGQDRIHELRDSSRTD